MPPQLQRIMLLFILFIVLFLGLRYFLVADSFGEYGHYRGDSLGEISSKQPKYIDQAECAECHEEIVDLKEMGLHDVVGCQICHGPGFLHRDTINYVEMIVPDTREYCSSCHQILTGRSTDWVNQIDVKEHNTDKNCIECHNPHEPWLELE